MLKRSPKFCHLSTINKQLLTEYAAEINGPIFVRFNIM